MAKSDTQRTDPKLEVAAGDEQEGYWHETRRPLTCLLFLLPLLAVYELGVVKLGGTDADHLRNGADTWLRRLLVEAGLTYAHLLPALVIGVFLVWQIAGKYPWRVSGHAFVGMLVESLFAAVCLVAFGHAQEMVFRECSLAAVEEEGSGFAVQGSAMLAGAQRADNTGRRADEAISADCPETADHSSSTHPHGAASPPRRVPASLSLPSDETLSRVVNFVGAGVYEEVLFRLALLPICFAFLRLLGVPGAWAAALAIVLTSVGFSAAHHVGPYAESFDLFRFLFRLWAGVFFAMLFVLRGFGVAAGAHAAYDMFVGLMG